MSSPTQAIYKIGPVFDSVHQTYSLTAPIDGSVEKLHFLYISEIDKKKNQVVLETVDPKKNFTPEQWKDIAKKYNIVVLGTVQGNKVVLSVPEMHRGNIPITDLEIVIKTGGKVSKLCEVNILQYFDNVKYGTVMKQYVEFFRFVVAHNAKQNQQVLVKK